MASISSGAAGLVVESYFFGAAGGAGFAAADFVQSIEADLLVIASEPSAGHAHFPARLEWLENVIPANLLVLRTDGETAA